MNRHQMLPNSTSLEQKIRSAAVTVRSQLPRSGACGRRGVKGREMRRSLRGLVAGDDRIMAGANASRTLDGSFVGRLVQTTFGVQTRYDDIKLALTDTYRRSLLSNVRSDRVGEASVGVFAQSTVFWTDWLKTTLGWRGDYFDTKVTSLFDANNSGRTSAAIGSPKFTMVIGPFNKTELFFGAGLGMHSNDARGATITEDPTDPAVKLSASPLLVRTKGAEAGVRTKFIPGLDSSVSLFLLHQASEIVFSGDAGDTSPSRI